MMKFTDRKFKQDMQDIGRKVPSLIVFTVTIFFFVALFGFFQSKWTGSSISSMKGLTASMNSQFFKDMLHIEMPSGHNENAQSVFSQENIANFAVQFLTNVNPSDPRSIVAGEIPGMALGQAVLLHRGTGASTNIYPTDYTPPQHMLQPVTPSEHKVPDIDPSDLIDSGTDSIAEGEPSNENPSSQDEPNEPDSENTTTSHLSTGGLKKVFIYHSHNRESWIPELDHADDLDEAFDATKNITLLGERMAKRLEELGIGAVNSKKDYPSDISDYNWSFSYKYSLKTVQEAFAAYPDITYLFDIHRDSQKRDLTTITIDGKDYAQLYFIIGHKNPNWEQNEQFARSIHEKIEAKYPGLSRGIWSKTAETGHAEYNQSLSPNSILVEVGGPENTLEESYRTIDILSSVIAEIFWDAEKVDAPVSILSARE